VSEDDLEGVDCPKCGRPAIYDWLEKCYICSECGAFRGAPPE